MSAMLSLMMLLLLIAAAWRDIATRTIPDTIGLLIVSSSVLIRIPEGLSALAVSAGIALFVFVGLLAAFSSGLLGGGDVKIMAAITAGLSPFDSYRFVVATAIAGGLLAITYFLLSYALRPVYQTAHTSLLRRVIAVGAWRIRRRGPLPYGVAIALGGALVLFHPGSF